MKRKCSGRLNIHNNFSDSDQILIIYVKNTRSSLKIIEYRIMATPLTGKIYLKFLGVINLCYQFDLFTNEIK
jgi:hypothetical protein